jgi:hypothetical protein
MPDREPVTELGQALAAVRPSGSLVGQYLAGWTADELDVLGFVADRLRLGRGRYGPLDIGTDGRDWRRERLEEAADGLIYSAIEVLKAELLRSREPGRERPALRHATASESEAEA